MRLAIRGIEHDLPREIYQTAAERYSDQETELRVAIGRGRHRGKTREFAVVYRETPEVVTLITIHPLKPNQKVSRIRSRRWLPLP